MRVQVFFVLTLIATTSKGIVLDDGQWLNF